jgi:Tetratricopeptide repeat
MTGQELRDAVAPIVLAVLFVIAASAHDGEVLNNLAVLYCDQGRCAEAEPLFKRTLVIDEKALGPDPLTRLGGSRPSPTSTSSSPRGRLLEDGHRCGTY